MNTVAEDAFYKELAEHKLLQEDNIVANKAWRTLSKDRDLVLPTIQKKNNKCLTIIITSFGKKK